VARLVTQVGGRYERLRKVIERGLKLVISDVDNEVLQRDLILKLLEVRELLDGERPDFQQEGS